MYEAVGFAGQQTRCWNAGPCTNDLCDVLGLNLLAEHWVVALTGGECLSGLGNPLFKFWDTSVAESRCQLQVGFTLDRLGEALQFLFEATEVVDGGLLGLPLGSQDRELVLEVGQLGVEHLKACL